MLFDGAEEADTQVPSGMDRNCNHTVAFLPQMVTPSNADDLPACTHQCLDHLGAKHSEMIDQKRYRVKKAPLAL